MEYLKTRFSDKRAVAQFVVEIVAILGVSKVVSQVIENNTASEKGLDRLKIKIGSLILGFIVVDYTTKYVSEAFTSVIDWFKDVKHELKEAEETLTTEE